MYSVTGELFPLQSSVDVLFFRIIFILMIVFLAVRIGIWLIDYFYNKK